MVYYQGPFFMLMMETRQRLEARGQRFPCGYDGVVEIASELWNNMTREQKEVYRQKNIEYKKSYEYFEKKMAFHSSRRKKRTKREEFVEEPLLIYPCDNEINRREFELKRDDDQRDLTMYMTWNIGSVLHGLSSFPICVVSVLNHAQTSDYKFYPAEIAVVEFTMEAGIQREKSFILGPFDLPNDVMKEANALQPLHNIPFDKSVPGMRNDFEKMIDELSDFHSRARRLLMFCISNEYNNVQGGLHFIKTSAKRKDIPNGDIKCIEDLFKVLCEQGNRVYTPAERRTFLDCANGNSRTFSGWKGIKCCYHTEHKSELCAMANAKRTCYYFLLLLQDHFHFEMTSNHRPPVME